MPHLQAEQIAREFADAALPPPPDDNVALFPVCSTVKVAEYEEMIFRLAETCPNMRLPKPPSYAYFTSSSCWAVVVYKSSHGLTADSVLRAVREKVVD